MTRRRFPDGEAGTRGGRHRPLTAVLAALTCAAVVACEGPGADGDGAADAERGGAAVVGVSTGVGTVLPPLARTSLDGEVSGLLFPGLNRVRWSEGRPAFRADHPLALAESWSFGPDSTSLTYRLAADARWSDGTPLTAGDVAFTFSLLSNPRAGLPLSYVTRWLDSTTTRGDTAVTLHFARRYPDMLYDTGVGVLPEHVYGEVAPGDFAELAGRAARSTDDGGGEGADTPEGGAGGSDAGAGGMVSSGPFRLAEWSRGERLVLVRNPEGTAEPRLDTLVFRILPEEATRLAELRSGGADLVRVESFRDARRLEERDGYRVHSIPRRAYDYIAWNPSAHPAFSDPRVREALSLAIDRQRVVEALEMGRWAEPAAGPYGPLFPQLRVDPEGELHDVGRARRLLEEAGWTLPAGADEDGVRSKDGRELSFELATQAGSDRRTAAAELVRGQLADVGVRAEIRTQEFNSLFGRMRAGNYEAALLGWQIGLSPDISQFWYDPESPLNVVSYDDGRVRALMDSARAAATSKEAEPFWRRAAREITSDHPYAFLWYFDVLYVSGPRLRGVEVGVPGFARNAHEWWVRAGDRSPPADTSP